jgi:hypothetical protein
MKHPIESPHDVRTAILAALHEQGRTRYAFAKDCATANLCQHKTVDSILTNPEALSATIPTLPTAITLLHHAGYELVAVPRKGPR